MTQFPLENVLQGRWVFSFNCILDHILKDVRNTSFLLNSYKTSGPSAQTTPLLDVARQLYVMAALLSLILVLEKIQSPVLEPGLSQSWTVLFRRPV